MGVQRAMALFGEGLTTPTGAMATLAWPCWLLRRLCMPTTSVGMAPGAAKSGSAS